MAVGVIGTSSLSGGMGPVTGLSRKITALQEAVAVQRRGSGQAEAPPAVVLVPRDNTNASSAESAVRLVEGWTGEVTKLAPAVGKRVKALAAESLFHAIALLLRPAAGPPLAPPPQPGKWLMLRLPVPPEWALRLCGQRRGLTGGGCVGA